MDLQKAWAVLGKDIREVKAEASSAGGLEERLAVLEQLLAEAKRTARRRMAENHPDKNPEDPKAAARFRDVKEAISLIERMTEDFRTSVTEALASRGAPKDGTIIIG